MPQQHAIAQQQNADVRQNVNAQRQNANARADPNAPPNANAQQPNANAPKLIDSGIYWVNQFPGSTRLDDLEADFRQRVQRFMDAITAAQVPLPANAPAAPPNANALPAARIANAGPGAPIGRGQAPAARVAAAVPQNINPRAHIRINCTLRAAQCAYLMHYCWCICAPEKHKNRIAPADVGRYQPIGDWLEPVNIQWVHRDPRGNPDDDASRAAALQMKIGFGMQNLHTAPALNSNHLSGRAVDMSISWQGNIQIVDGNGRTVLIDTLPRDGTNARLIEVGKSYGVLHYLDIGADRPHWSYDGH